MEGGECVREGELDQNELVIECEAEVEGKVECEPEGLRVEDPGGEEPAALCAAEGELF